MSSAVSFPLVLYGAGGHTHVLEKLAHLTGYSLRAVLNDWNPPTSFETDVPVIIGSAEIERWLEASREFPQLSYAISIGNHFGKERVDRHRYLRSKGLSPLNLCHPTAFVSSDAHFGDACQVLAFGHVGTRSSLGEAVIINTRASIDHECVLGNGVHIAPGAVLAGRVTIGDNTFVGTGASIGPDVTITKDCIIGAGSVVVRDILDPGTYVGMPARKIRSA